MPKSSSRPKVLLVESIHPHFLAILEKRCEVIRPKGFKEQDLIEAARDVDGILIRTKGLVNAKIIASAPKLKVVARHGVGLDHIDLEAAAKAGVWVVYTPAGSLDAVAEHTWMMILDLAKHARKADLAVRALDYSVRDKFPSLQLKGKTLGILGLGRIGTRVAEIGAQAFGMKVIYTDVLKFPKKEKKLGAKKVSLAKLLAQSDVLSIHLPLTKQTEGLLGEKEFKQMKPTAYLINCARGAIFDTYALADALNAGTIAGAGTDVFDPEPPPADHPLLKCPNAILSPHNAAQTAEARWNYSEVVLDLLRVLDGKKPLYPGNAPR